MSVQESKLENLKEKKTKEKRKEKGEEKREILLPRGPTKNGIHQVRPRIRQALGVLRKERPVQYYLRTTYVLRGKYDYLSLGSPVGHHLCSLSARILVLSKVWGCLETENACLQQPYSCPSFAQLGPF
ncbi:hypothetical protein ACRALDRAFT_211294 [Sodiomyces alcalophilus JCM 7366]|uniref:uncharacterized protein n=1 Tax=Sodiomyces alcalophilus JCM 7366 TaxID=591952 RepID=UPI0039B64D6E